MYRPYQRTKLVRQYTWYTFFQSTHYSYVNRKEERFEEIHGKDTDEALILYLQDSARELGYSPRYKEIIGWGLLEQRFGGWNEALQKAGLIPAPRCPVTKLPRIIEETEKQKEIYRQRKAEKKLRNRQMS